MAVSSASAAPLGPGTFRGTTAHGDFARVLVTDCGKTPCRTAGAPKSGLAAELIVKVNGEDLICEGSGPPRFSGGIGSSLRRITSTRRFKFTRRSTDRETKSTYVRESIRTTVITGRFSADGRKVSGTYQESVENRVVSGTPSPYDNFGGKCDTGTVTYTAKRTP
jgi:hypothetical protein